MANSKRVCILTFLIHTCAKNTSPLIRAICITWVSLF